MRIITPDAYRRLPWKNGLGTTLEVASDAGRQGGDWTWRVSVADVPARAPFSPFPGVDRFIACLQGPGLRLEREGRRFLVPRRGPALAFPGEEAVVGAPLGPGVKDFNLMLRRGHWRARMRVVRGGALRVSAPVVVVHTLGSSTLLASGTLHLPAQAGAVRAACELTPAP